MGQPLTASLLLALAWAAEAPQTEPVPTGRIVRSLPTLADPAQSYALYLPTTYTRDRSWPILYCFDPMARGAVPVELFAEAAEAHGWIVVGSNNSRNGPQDVIDRAAGALWNDTRARLRLDPARLYATGFSGGARVASIFAAALGFAGLIGVGAGFSQGLEPNAALPFVYFGVAGHDDFNLFEVHELHARLAAAGLKSHLATFDGGHSWPPGEIAARAVAWLELQAMRAGTLSVDKTAIERYHSAVRERIVASAAGSYDRFLLLRQTVADLQGLADVGELQVELDRLRPTKAVERGERRERDLFRDERRRNEELAILRRDALDTGRRSLLLPRDEPSDMSPAERAARDLELLLGALRRQADADEPSDQRAIARRSLYGFLVSCREDAREARRAKDYDLALALWRFVVLGQPKAAQPHVQVAALHALKGDGKRALRSLSQALELSFADAEALTAETAFDSIRNGPEFQALLAKARAAGGR